MTDGMMPSYLKVNYALRPAKQVERRMLIDALQVLGFAGFPIRDFQYTGLGSLWFIDFMLVHKMLGIQRMLSVEQDAGIVRRVEYNQPFRCVQTRMAASKSVIPDLSRELKHILWLDYDRRLQLGHLEDARLAAASLTPASILIITVDIEPPGETLQKNYQYFRDIAGDFWDPKFRVEQFGRDGLASVSTALLHRAMLSGLAARPGLRFLPLFKFIYADGHRMLTVGGMIGGRNESRRLNGSGLRDCVYVRRSLDDDPFEILVPPLTRRERLHLDQNMPCPKDWAPDAFPLDPEFIKKYRDIYRFFPGYEELLI